jgi:hypothetical protein
MKQFLRTMTIAQAVVTLALPLVSWAQQEDVFAFIPAGVRCLKT